MSNVIDSLFVALGFKIDDKELKQFKKEVDQVKDSAEALHGVLNGLIAGGLAMLGKSFLDTAAQFEKFETVLGVIEGSEEKGKAALSWVSDFAAKTPYELTEVTEAFVKLRSYGLEPTNGLLKTLGDTSAAMGKPLMQAVEAIADAITGENERLKEFGITAKVTGEKITYAYIKNGEEIKKTVDKNNKALIQATLEGIWNDKYAGAMDKLSMTWVGMWSNFKDSITRFKNNVMEAGPFKQIKAGLAALLESINKAFDSGSVKRFAEIAASVFATIAKVFEIVWRVLDVLIGKTIGWKAALSALAVVISGVFLTSLVKTVATVASLLRGLMAVNWPLVAMIAGFLALAAAVALVVDDFETWRDGGESVIGDLIKQFPWLEDAINGIAQAVDDVMAGFSEFGMVMGGIMAELAPPIGDLLSALWRLASVLLTAVWPVVKMIFSGWAELVKLVLPVVTSLVALLTNSLVSVINGIVETITSAVNKVTGLVNGLVSAGQKVGQFLGLSSGPAAPAAGPIAGAVAKAPALGGTGAAGQTAAPSVAAKGGVLGKGADAAAAGKPGATTNNNVQITAPITVNSPDPAKAGESVKKELDRVNKQTTRNGGSAVAL